MNNATKVAAFAGALAIVFGGAWAAGAAVGPFDERASPDAMDHGAAQSTSEIHDELPPGLSMTENGYVLNLASTTATAGAEQQFRFTIGTIDGGTVTKFDVEHENVCTSCWCAGTVPASSTCIPKWPWTAPGRYP